MKRQIFRNAVEKFSGQKLTDQMLTKTGYGFHDFAIGLLGRITHTPLLSQDHVYMLNHVLPRTWGLFRFSDEVAPTLFDMRGKVFKLFKEEETAPRGNEAVIGVHKYMKPPYPICWIERPHDQASDTTFCYLVESEPRAFVDSTFANPSLRFIQFVHDPKTGIIPLPGVTYVGRGNPPFDLHLDERTYKKSERKEVIESLLSSGSAIMAALLLLNCRSPVFKFPGDPVAERAKNLSPDKRDEFESRLLKDNKRYRAPTIIKFDFTRMMRHHNLNKAVAHREVIMHLVRGHFKLRKSGVWYWSHHMRGNIMPKNGETEIKPQEYDAVRGSPRKFGLPDGVRFG